MLYQSELSYFPDREINVVWIIDKLGETKPACKSGLRTPQYYNELLAPALPGERHAQATRLLGHVLSRKPEPAVLLILVMSHIRLTYPDRTDFGDDEIEKIAVDILNKEDKKRSAA